MSTTHRTLPPRALIAKRLLGLAALSVSLAACSTSQPTLMHLRAEGEPLLSVLPPQATADGSGPTTTDLAATDHSITGKPAPEPATAGAWEVDEQPKFEISLGLGHRFAGSYTVDDEDFDNDAGFMYRLTLDYFPVEHLGVGLFVLNTTGGNEMSALSTTMFGVGLKGRFGTDLAPDARLLITPGAGIGLAKTSVDYPPGSDTTGLGVILGLDCRVRFSNRFDIFVEPGVMWQPTGGNENDQDVTSDPNAFVLLGIGVAL